MKKLRNVNLISKVSFSAILALALTAHAIIDPAKIPSISLTEAVPGSTSQTVEDIPDKSHLSLFYNDLLINEMVNLPGWKTAIKKTPDEKEIYNAFGVRTAYSKATSQAPQSVFFVGKNVGRSGVWEKEIDGDAFAAIHGRPLKGLTIKGYGGNLSSNRLQPDGSLDVSEAYRDMLLSKILAEKGADTYLGALAVVRPAGSGETQANYIRLSRSSLRLNDVIDRQGADLERTLLHLRNLLTDELGAKPSIQEFADWLVQRSALTLARKEHARVTASNHNKDNFGIAELVDFGEAEYKPFNFELDKDVMGVGKNMWSPGLKIHVMAAAANIAKSFPIVGDYNSMFDHTFQTERARLLSADAARVLLDRATAAELKSIGLSDLITARILRLQTELNFGILAKEDVLQKLPMTLAETKIIQEKTTTQAMKLADGHILSSVLLSEVGGTDGLRGILLETLSHLNAMGLADEKILRDALAMNIRKKMSELKTDRYISSSHGPQVATNLSLQLSRKIIAQPTVWNSFLTNALRSVPAPNCSAVF